MIKAHKHSKQPMMRRSARVYLTELNTGKLLTLTIFLRLCHDTIQYFVDLFWQQKDLSAKLANLPTIHRGRDRFGITTRLTQAMAKQAKECVRGRSNCRKPKVRNHTVVLYYHFVSVEPFRGKGFDYAVRLTGSGAPRMTIPIRSTKVINKFLNRGWTLSKTIRLGRNGRRLFVELIFEKPRPSLKEYGRVAGMDSNYKSGLVLSDGQNVGQEIYQRIQTFGKHQKHTHAEIKSLVGHAIRQIDFSGIRVLCIEELKRVKYHKRGTFPRSLNRRLSHWLYNYIVGILRRYCEELGIRLEEKSPWKTSQYCRFCNRWDRRNRRGDKFICVHCKCSEDADYNASKNLELLGLAGVYGLRSLINSDRCLENNGFE